MKAAKRTIRKGRAEFAQSAGEAAQTSAAQVRLSWWIVVAPPVVAALVIRAILLPQIMARFPFYAGTVPGFDQHTYNMWAQEIAAGDWLSRARGAFYYSPLYPYMLALAYMAAGSGKIGAGVAMNAFFGAAACGIAADLGRRLFSHLAGLAAGLLLAVSGSQIAYEGILLNDSVMTFFTLAGLWGFHICREETRDGPEAALNPARLARWLFAGIPFGLLIAGRASNLMPAAGLIGMIAWERRADLRQWRRLIGPALFVLAVVLPATGIVIRNRALGGVWGLTTNGPINFYIGNAPGATGTFNYPPGFAAAQKEINTLPLAEQGVAWKARLRAELADHPGARAGNLWKKTALFLNSWDAPDNVNIYFFRDQMFLHRLLPSPRVLYALGVLGMVLTFGAWRRLLPIHIFSMLFAVSLIVVFIAGRYKLPFLGVLAVFSGAALENLIGCVRSRNWPRLGLLFTGVVAGLFIFAPRVNEPDYYRELLRPNEFLQNAKALASGQRPAEAEGLCARARELFPAFPDFWALPAQQRINSGDWVGVLNLTTGAINAKTASQPLAEMHVLALTQLKQPVEARTWAERFAPHFPQSAILREAAGKK